MADYSGEAFGGKGREPEENLRIFLGCKKARPGTQAYDFSKGSAKFEYKHSRLHLTRRHGTKAPLNRWQFSNLRGQGGNKSYDYLILEGDAERGGDSYLFVISFQELSASFPGANVFVVTLPRVGGRGLRRGGRSEFVGSTESAEQLKARIDQYADSSGGAGCSLGDGVSKEPRKPASERKEVGRPRSRRVRAGQSERTSQLSFPWAGGFAATQTRRAKHHLGKLPKLFVYNFNRPVQAVPTGEQGGK